MFTFNPCLHGYSTTRTNRKLYSLPCHKFLEITCSKICISAQLVEPGYTNATSSSTHPGYPASRTVDGDFNQTISRCSHTDAKPDIKEAWLRVDLKKIFSIRSVKFWYRKTGRFLGLFTLKRERERERKREREREREREDLTALFFFKTLIFHML